MNIFKKTILVSLLICFYFYPYNNILAESSDYNEILIKINEIENNFYIVFSDLIEAEKLGADTSSNIDDLNLIINNIDEIKDLIKNNNIDEAKSYTIITEEIIEKIKNDIKTQVDSRKIKRQQIMQINIITSIIIIVIGVFIWKKLLKIYNDSIIKLKPEVEKTEYKML